MEYEEGKLLEAILGELQQIRQIMFIRAEKDGILKDFKQ